MINRRRFLVLPAVGAAAGVAAGCSKEGGANVNGVNNLPTLLFPEQYGAVGDGSTDDTVAMRKFMAALSAGHKTGLLTPGKNYKITDEIPISGVSNNWHLWGCGATITQATDGKAILDVAAHTVGYVTIRDICFDYTNQQSSSNSATSAISVDYVDYGKPGLYNSTLHNLWFSGNCYRGIFLKETAGHHVRMWGNTFSHLSGDYRMTGSLIRIRGLGNTGMPNNRFENIWGHRAYATEPTLDLASQMSPVLTNIETNESYLAGNDLLIEYSTNVLINSIRTERGSNNTGDAVWKFRQCTGQVTGFECQARSYDTNPGFLFELVQGSIFSIGSGDVTTYAPYADPGANLTVVKVADDGAALTSLGQVNKPRAVKLWSGTGPLEWRTTTITSLATPSIDTDACDLVTITALATNITSMTTKLTGSPANGQRLTIRIKDNGSSQSITWGDSFTSSGAATLLAATVARKTHTIDLIYDSVAGKWICLTADATGY
jgi:hypothetical protein